MRTEYELLALRDKVLESCALNVEDKTEEDKWKYAFAMAEEYYLGEEQKKPSMKMTDYWARGCSNEYIKDIFKKDLNVVHSVLQDAGFIAPRVHDSIIYNIQDVNAVILGKCDKVRGDLVSAVRDEIARLGCSPARTYVLSEDYALSPEEEAVLLDYAIGGMGERRISALSGRSLGDVLCILGYTLGLDSTDSVIRNEFVCNRSIDFIRKMFDMSGKEVCEALIRCNIPVPTSGVKDFCVADYNAMMKDIELYMEKFQCGVDSALGRGIADAANANGIIPKRLTIMEPKYLSNMELKAIKYMSNSYSCAYIAESCNRGTEFVKEIIAGKRVAYRGKKV